MYRADCLKRHDDTVHVIMVARFESPKDQNLLVRAMSQLQDLPWTLELVGEGPTRTATEKLVAELHLERRVSFPGACTDVPARLARSDIAVLASHWEALPLTILEAMRAALPVIASNVGGVPELIEHNVNGLLVAKASAEELAQALRTLITQPELRRRMGSCGRQRYEREFTQELMAQRLANIYETCIVAARAAPKG
jgi:glycosyltransferase involved in cell wall biosynthesis